MKIPIWNKITISWGVICLVNKYIRYKKPSSDGGVKLSDNEKKSLFSDINKLVINAIGQLKGKRFK